MSKSPILKGAFILTVTGFLTRFIGFFFRIFLSHTFGEEQVGIYQLIFPIFALGYSLSVAGIETALSRSIARKFALGKKEEADNTLYHALCISVSVSVFLCVILKKHATVLSIYILGDLRCEPLLLALSYAFPFASLHSCIQGYFLGQKQTKVSAVSQFIEQLVRVGSVYILFLLCLNKQSAPTINLAVCGLVFGEMASAFFCLRFFLRTEHTAFSVPALWKSRTLGKELFTLSLPLTCTRLFTNILQSIESISIPLCLQRYGFSTTEALSTYGVLTGMALPCILFPTAATSAISTMLLPAVAEIQAADNHRKLSELIRKIFLLGFFFGCLCGIFFLLLGTFIGNLLFGSSLAGNFIQTLAFICPFLYTNGTYMSILNGLGKTTTSFTIHTCSLVIRVVGVLAVIPIWGMQGYLWALLLSQLFISASCLLSIRSYIKTAYYNQL